MLHDPHLLRAVNRVDVGGDTGTTSAMPLRMNTLFHSSVTTSPHLAEPRLHTCSTRNSTIRSSCREQVGRARRHFIKLNCTDMGIRCPLAFFQDQTGARRTKPWPGLASSAQV
jgi:hypothetical protein